MKKWVLPRLSRSSALVDGSRLVQHFLSDRVEDGRSMSNTGLDGTLRLREKLSLSLVEAHFVFFFALLCEESQL